MRLWTRICLLGALTVMLCNSQRAGGIQGAHVDSPGGGTPEQARQRELQQLHEDNLEDTSRLIKLATELKWDLAYHDREVLSIPTIKKMEQIDRLIHRIQNRVAKR